MLDYHVPMIKSWQNTRRPQRTGFRGGQIVERTPRSGSFVMSAMQLYGGLMGMFSVGVIVGILCAGIFELYR